MSYLQGSSTRLAALGKQFTIMCLKRTLPKLITSDTCVEWKRSEVYIMYLGIFCIVLLIFCIVLYYCLYFDCIVLLFIFCIALYYCLYFVLHCTIVIFCIALYYCLYFVLHCTIVYILYCIVLLFIFCIALYYCLYFVLHCTMFYILYCIVSLLYKYPWKGRLDRIMQLNWLYIYMSYICRVIPLKVWSNTARSCNHHSPPMPHQPRLQHLCSAALVRMYPRPEGIRRKARVSHAQWSSPIKNTGTQCITPHRLHCGY